MEKAKKPVLLCLVTRNRLEFTRATLDSLLQNTTPVFDLVIIDNASTDGTREYLDTLPAWIRVIKNRQNLGPAKSWNMALRLKAPEQHFFKLDNDLLFETAGHPDWLARAVETAEKYPDLGQLCLRPYNHRNIAPYPTTLVNGLELQVLDRDCTIGFGFLYTRNAIDKVGAFCEEYGLWGFDDSDLCHRIKLAGFRTAYLPGVKVNHLGEVGSSQGSTISEKQKKKIIWWKAPQFERNLRKYRRGRKPLRLPLHNLEPVRRDTNDYYLDKDPLKLVSPAIIRYVKARAGHKVLDLGCGLGGYSAKLNALGFDCLGADINERYLRTAAGLGVKTKL
ncbi:MAG TPA: glycosyltransferase, partial [Candidatus Sulfotelmatobacter sp.]|nr:glycosyltransferase [Candidatus Sulfotelmatobacter sp.]